MISQNYIQLKNNITNKFGNKKDKIVGNGLF